jgi:hypothetical protein
MIDFREIPLALMARDFGACAKISTALRMMRKKLKRKSPLHKSKRAISVAVPPLFTISNGILRQSAVVA